ncbi:M23 family peptidase [Nocardioides marmoriginsengisoli]|uniref:M23 family peptidase n=1 Tax=Nocardioides marmoriginsengisoli TaxID=661483 RepID=A0A3N0CNS4_9ACTN|nr:peptidoglycan DD-metalloendopeptidase family protein [Nocardioides marmoriginsengisoli]RNL65122.1 M23 family peptidase [Nocardioides marmoriginsengisoli]
MFALLASVLTALGTWPLVPQPEVVAPFAPPLHAWSAGHRGVDLLGSPGQPVRAALGGRVTFAGTIAGRGVVVVGHGARRTTYEPVRATAARGAEVGTGEQLGTLEPGGSHCFPRTCLHWGLIEQDPDGGEVYRDPLTLLGLGPVRLLPLE